MLGADLEPSVVLAEALRVARESARAADAEHLLEQDYDPARAGTQHHCRRRPGADDCSEHEAAAGNGRRLAADRCRLQHHALDEQLQVVLPH